MSPEAGITEAERAADARLMRDALTRAITKAADLIDTVDEPEPGAEPPTKAETTDRYDTLSRALRRAVQLLDRVGAPPQTTAPNPRRPGARRIILRDVENTIAKTTPDPDDAALLRTELSDRLDGPDLDDDIDHRPVADIVTDICRDLGIAPYFGHGAAPWNRRTPEDIAILAAEAAKPRPATPPDPKPRLIRRPPKPSERPIPPRPPPLDPNRGPANNSAEEILAYLERTRNRKPGSG